MPRPDNRITLSKTVKDRFGNAAAHVNCDEHANDVALRAHAQAQGRKVYEAVGAKQVLFGPTPPATHQMGTARMSHDPAAGVTNAHGQAHEVPNLFISDGSVFTTPGAANPTLTIVALVLRQADYIERQLKARAI